MPPRFDDGSAGDADYGRIGAGYSRLRQPDPRIAAAILEALGDARRVLNVGAGAGSYEPTDREVVAVEPSAAMRAQRPPHLSQAIDATAEALPFEDLSFDASLASVTVHQWTDLFAGLSEMRRVTRGPVVILTADPRRLTDFWLNDYAPEALAVEAQRFPELRTIGDALGGFVEVRAVPIPLDCRDGFNEAYYGRPERLLDAHARQACSSWSFLSANVIRRFVETLSHDLADGTWDCRHGRLRTTPTYDGSLRLVICRGDAG